MPDVKGIVNIDIDWEKLDELYPKAQKPQLTPYQGEVSGFPKTQQFLPNQNLAIEKIEPTYAKQFLSPAMQQLPTDVINRNMGMKFPVDKTPPISQEEYSKPLAPNPIFENKYLNQFIEPSRQAVSNVENFSENPVANAIGLPTNIAHQIFAPFSTGFTAVTDAIRNIPSVNVTDNISIGGKEFADALDLPFRLLSELPSEGAKAIDKTGIFPTDKEISDYLGVDAKTVSEIASKVSDVNSLASTLLGLKIAHQGQAKITKSQMELVDLEKANQLGLKALNKINGERPIDKLMTKVGEKVVSPKLVTDLEATPEAVLKAENRLTKEGLQHFKKRLEDPALTPNEKQIAINYLEKQGINISELGLNESKFSQNTTPKQLTFNDPNLKQPKTVTFEEFEKTITPIEQKGENFDIKKFGKVPIAEDYFNQGLNINETIEKLGAKGVNEQNQIVGKWNKWDRERNLENTTSKAQPFEPTAGEKVTVPPVVSKVSSEVNKKTDVPERKAQIKSEIEQIKNKLGYSPTTVISQAHIDVLVGNGAPENTKLVEKWDNLKQELNSLPKESKQNPASNQEVSQPIKLSSLPQGLEAKKAEAEPVNLPKDLLESSKIPTLTTKLNGKDSMSDYTLAYTRPNGKKFARVIAYKNNDFATHFDVFEVPNQKTRHFKTLNGAVAHVKSVRDSKKFLDEGINLMSEMGYGKPKSEQPSVETEKNPSEMADLANQVAESSKEVEKQEFIFHGTGEGAFRQIREQGLKTKDGKIFFADTEKYAETYASRKGNAYGNRVLRIKKPKDVQRDERIKGGEDFIYSKDIEPKDIEVKVGNEWKPIQEYYDEDLNIRKLDTNRRNLDESLDEKPKVVTGDLSSLKNDTEIVKQKTDDLAFKNEKDPERARKQAETLLAKLRADRNHLKDVLKLEPNNAKAKIELTSKEKNITRLENALTKNNLFEQKDATFTPKPKKNKAMTRRNPQSQEEAVLQYFVGGGAVNPTEIMGFKEFRESFNLTPFQVSKKGARLDTFLSDLGILTTEQFNDPDFSQEEFVMNILRKYSAHENRVKALKLYQSDEIEIPEGELEKAMGIKPKELTELEKLERELGWATIDFGASDEEIKYIQDKIDKLRKMTLNSRS